MSGSNDEQYLKQALFDFINPQVELPLGSIVTYTSLIRFLGLKAVWLQLTRGAKAA